MSNLDEIACRKGLSFERLEDEEAVKAPLGAADRHRLSREMACREERECDQKQRENRTFWKRQGNGLLLDIDYEKFDGGSD